MRKEHRITQIGIDRIIRFAWLEKTAELVLAGNSAQGIKVILQNDLSFAFRSERNDIRGALDKTITVLMRVWLKVPNELESLRIGGLDLFKSVPRHDHKAVHWGMLLAVYPFWSGVATQVGRLLRLQGSATARQIQRRIREQYGERETVSRAVQRVLRSYIDWGVLIETGEKGVYCAGKSLAIDDHRLIAWLVEAYLYSRDNEKFPLKHLLDNPCLFPFRFKPIHAESLLAASRTIDILRHGLNDDLVILRK